MATAPARHQFQINETETWVHSLLQGAMFLKGVQTMAVEAQSAKFIVSL